MRISGGVRGRSPRGRVPYASCLPSPALADEEAEAWGSQSPDPLTPWFPQTSQGCFPGWGRGVDLNSSLLLHRRNVSGERSKNATRSTGPSIHSCHVSSRPSGPTLGLVSLGVRLLTIQTLTRSPPSALKTMVKKTLVV